MVPCHSRLDAAPFLGRSKVSGINPRVTASRDKSWIFEVSGHSEHRTGHPWAFVLHFLQMRNTLTVRLPDDLSQWLEEAARKSGVSRGMIIRTELEKARESGARPFMRLAGAVDGPPNLSSRKGFSRK